MKTLAKKLMALVLCLAMALGLLGVTSAGAVQSAPKAEESASKVIYATDSKTTYVPAGYTYVYQSTDGRIYTRKATQDTYISGRTLSATEAKALASLSYGAESTITTDDGQTLVCREYDAKEAAAYSDAVKAILSGEDYSNGDKVTVVSEAHEKNDKVKVIISLEAPAVCEMDGMSVELGKGLGKAELAVWGRLVHEGIQKFPQIFFRRIIQRGENADSGQAAVFGGLAGHFCPLGFQHLFGGQIAGPFAKAAALDKACTAFEHGGQALVFGQLHGIARQLFGTFQSQIHITPHRAALLCRPRRPSRYLRSFSGVHGSARPPWCTCARSARWSGTPE